MFSSKEKQRRVTAAQKRVEDATARINRHQEKVEEARIAKTEATAELDWLKAMPVKEEPQLTIEGDPDEG